MEAMKIWESKLSLFIPLPGYQPESSGETIDRMTGNQGGTLQEQQFEIWHGPWLIVLVNFLSASHGRYRDRDRYRHVVYYCLCTLIYSHAV